MCHFIHLYVEITEPTGKTKVSTAAVSTVLVLPVVWILCQLDKTNSPICSVFGSIFFLKGGAFKNKMLFTEAKQLYMYSY